MDFKSAKLNFETLVAQIFKYEDCKNYKRIMNKFNGRGKMRFFSRSIPSSLNNDRAEKN